MKKQKQKKILVVAAIALMIALVSGMGAMTYARYISSTDVPTQHATAAKWGFVVTANADKLLSTDYVKGATYAEPVDAGDGVAVKATGSADVVAPGTSGSMTISISGQAEVAAKLTFTVSSLGDIGIPAKDYYPVKWSINGTGIDKSGLTLAELTTELNKLTRELPAGTPVTANYTISWAWEFNDADTAEAKEASLNDTLIGFRRAEVLHDTTADKADLSEVLAHDGDTYQSKITKAEYEAITTEFTFDLKITIAQIQTLTNP